MQTDNPWIFSSEKQGRGARREAGTVADTLDVASTPATPPGRAHDARFAVDCRRKGIAAAGRLPRYSGLRVGISYGAPRIARYSSRNLAAGCTSGRALVAAPPWNW